MLSGSNRTVTGCRCLTLLNSL